MKRNNDSRRRRIEKNIRESEELERLAALSEAQRSEYKVAWYLRMGQVLSCVGYGLVLIIAVWGFKHLMPQHWLIATILALVPIGFVFWSGWSCGLSGGYDEVIPGKAEDDKSSKGALALKGITYAAVALLMAEVIIALFGVFESGYAQMSNDIAKRDKLVAQKADLEKRREANLALVAAAPDDHITAKTTQYKELVAPLEERIDALSREIGELETGMSSTSELSNVGVLAQKLGVHPDVVALVLAVIIALILDPVLYAMTYYTNLSIARRRDRFEKFADADEEVHPLSPGQWRLLMPANDNGGVTNSRRKRRRSKQNSGDTTNRVP